MTTFNDREAAFENQFVHDEELKFKALARRNKLLGLWAAEKMGMDSLSAVEYAKSVVKADFEEPGDEDVIRKVLGDFERQQVKIGRDELVLQLEKLFDEAKRQVMIDKD
ncbi:hypothetical protein EV659_102221 [Rhodothalassium salexigens DSM 2132]|uniref:DUF1476 domain-containing protein n=1 Tax=Rhodothalassium salexigens DSM 2132 TaxID=1188247 RepID=A0A4R2PPW1_RHOSA|nr:DUF1476 domain-containing protein [Rhodothalassium salexigens]MBB4210630.1 hypothetical protein [Rhodothalassium salexigens DSM 2132]MBK1639056.1 aldolase [Rhodothalassium salexigens DSM 2132]TCP37813.1 hypothetical protein EV659_102221 [Rhodothalassium salexigens DSM 2132]